MPANRCNGFNEFGMPDSIGFLIRAVGSIKLRQELVFRHEFRVVLQRSATDVGMRVQASLFHQTVRKSARFVHAKHDTREPAREVGDPGLQLQNFIFSARQVVTCAAQVSEIADHGGGALLCGLEAALDGRQGLYRGKLTKQNGEPSCGKQCLNVETVPPQRLQHADIRCLMPEEHAKVSAAQPDLQEANTTLTCMVRSLFLDLDIHAV